MNNMNDNRSKAGLVERYIGTAYDIVKQVADAINAGWLTPNNMQAVDTAHALLIKELGGTSTNLDKPYFTRGNLHINDGGGAYYVYDRTTSKSLADGILYIDPTSPLDQQGLATGFGVWKAQTTISMQEGPQGAQGVQGDIGARGIPGRQGIAGTPGQDGVNGTNGHDGAAGVDGTDGTNGVDGTHGENGLHGTHGSNGADGADGAQGHVGLPGQDGTDGNDGTSFTVKGYLPIDQIVRLDGGVGFMYISSTDGIMPNQTIVKEGDGIISGGVNTPWRSVGPIKGPRGYVGAPGAEGPMGPQGKTGPIGPIGLTGQSIVFMGTAINSAALASIVNVENGYIVHVMDTGTMWVYDDDPTNRHHLLTLASIGNWHNMGVIRGAQGSTGPKGATGPAGATGPKGATGARGPTGLTGPTGPKGDRGIQGVKGDKGNGNFFSGKTNPASTLGVNGDIYVKYI